MAYQQFLDMKPNPSDIVMADAYLVLRSYPRRKSAEVDFTGETRRRMGSRCPPVSCHDVVG